MADIIIYGGSFAGAAAASKAAANAPNKSVLVVIPDPICDSDSGFGSIGTIGGQNFFDIRNWRAESADPTWPNPVKGTFQHWLSIQGPFYSTEKMATQLKNDVTKYANVTVLYGYDIMGISYEKPFHLTGLHLCNIYRDSNGIVQWGNRTETVSGSVFVDASDDGRLTRLSNFGGTTGRFDWPERHLDPDETTSPGKGRQQVATLMFQITDVDTTTKDADCGTEQSEFVIHNGIYGGGGGKHAYRTNPKILSFNQTWGPRGFALKPFNIAQDGKNSANWWVNTLLVFNVDGRACNRDRGTYRFPKDMRDDYKTVDDAWVEARNLVGSPEFLSALRGFPAFAQAQLVRDASGDPVVGKTLYLRETIHTAQSSSPDHRVNGSENSNYVLTAQASNWAGPATADNPHNSDQGNYATRIGLHFYYSDINAYQYQDLMDEKGNYLWFHEVGAKVRPDLGITNQTPKNPVYVPFRTLTTNFVANLLIPGYAASISSFAWAEARVIPNLCVLGDAAGVAAAYAANNGKHPQNFTDRDIAAIQNILKKSNVRLNK